MIELDQDQYDALTEALDNFSWDDEAMSIHPDYSGRGMYGASCLGVSVERIEGFELGVALGQSNLDVDDWDCRSDSLGLGTIYYWPNVKIADDVVQIDYSERWQ